MVSHWPPSCPLDLVCQFPSRLNEQDLWRGPLVRWFRYFLFYFVVLFSCVMFCCSLPLFVLFPPFFLFICQCVLRFLCQFVCSVFPASVLCLLCSSCSRLCPQCFCSTLLLFLLCIFVDLYSRICLRAPSACQCLDWKLPLLPLWLLFNESMDSTCSPVPFPTLYQICFWLNVAFFFSENGAKFVRQTLLYHNNHMCIHSLESFPFWVTNGALWYGVHLFLYISHQL